jgi:hypothetical protein
MKWVSLLLWAGADPLSNRTSVPGESPYEDEDGGRTALELAGMYQHFEVFELKPVRSLLNGKVAIRLLGELTSGKGLGILERLLAEGLDPNDPAGEGCPAIARCLEGMGEWWYTCDPGERFAPPEPRLALTQA